MSTNKMPSEDTISCKPIENGIQGGENDDECSIDSSLPEPDYDFLDFSTSVAAFVEEDQNCSNSVDNQCQSLLGQHSASTNTDPLSMSQYILGTLIVRVVAARNLKPVVKGGLGHFLWGKNNHANSHSNRSRSNRNRNADSGGGFSNPYATLCFCDQVQRTSQAYETINPVFPRSEQSYFDVSIPVYSLAVEEDQIGTSRSTYSRSRNTERKKKKDVQIYVSPDNQKINAAENTIPNDHSNEYLRTQSNRAINNDKNKTSDFRSTITYLPPPIPLLTINMFHAKADSSSKLKNKTELNNTLHNNPDQDHHLGGATINVNSIITGKLPYIDSWIPLHMNEHYQHITNNSTNNNNQYSSYASSKNNNAIPYNGEVRIICEYEPTDPPPRPGDMCRLTGFCNPTHYLYPLTNPSQLFLVNDILGNDVILSYKSSPENWNCQFRVHRHMIVCAVRHQAAIEKYRDHIINIADKLIQSPIYDTVADVVKRKLPDEGLLQVGSEGIVNGFNLLGRWLGGGIEVVVGDIVYATNLNGHHSSSVFHSNENNTNGTSDINESDSEETSDDFIAGHLGTKEDLEGPDDLKLESIPGMPNCPITGQPMRNPVVAADGHTYEKSAIVRWLQNSDTSPLTGQTMHHKEVVPNYLLLSSLNDEGRKMDD